MKTQRSGRKLLIAALLLMPLMIGTSPIVPLHRYIIKGHISRPEGREKGNFIVTVMAKFVTNLPEPEVWELTSDTGPRPSNYIQCITDSTGLFYLDVSSTRKADSIAVKVSAPDKPAFVSTYVSLKDAVLTEIVSRYSNPTEPGCSGCGSEPQYSTYVSTFQYTFPDKTVNLPY
ncbi:MAG: hypothetical protein ACM3Q2_15950 [Syntrophothermus sp.]